MTLGSMNSRLNLETLHCKPVVGSAVVPNRVVDVLYILAQTTLLVYASTLVRSYGMWTTGMGDDQSDTQSSLSAY
jgi:hypothetical protein